MNAQITWLDDPEVFRVNKLPAHSDHICYQSVDEMESQKSSLYQSLDGVWQFSYAVNAKERNVDFYKEEIDTTGFDEIIVPGHIELSGYDKLHYINTMYPWEGHIFRRPAYALSPEDKQAGSFSEADYNPVGSYRRIFDLEKELTGKRVCIRFEGVEQAMYVWLNGRFVGYSEDSFTPAEFDLTPFIREKGNVLAVEVHKRSTAAYLEDQDFFRFFGIYRSVTLYAKPALHVEDMWAKPFLMEDNKNGSFSLKLRLSSEDNATVENKNDLSEHINSRINDNISGTVVVRLQSADGKVIYEKDLPAAPEMMIPAECIGEVIPWDNHKPYLYNLTIELKDSFGETVEVTGYQIGFRRIEIQNKIILLNGRRLIINGVNRHEWSAGGGRNISLTDMEWDVDFMRRNNINAVRTCHYPDQIPWYYLCDKNGIYLMSETNLESHGSWQKAGRVEPSWNIPGNVSEWKNAVLDRANTNFETFKNHTSVLFWSLGNESYAGENIVEMNRLFHEKDSTRLVHYEGVAQNPPYKDRISDVESRMYAKPEEIRDYLSNDPKKPYILCEYMHDMGNSLGGMKSYMDLLDEFEMYQGGFIWDYMDQALYVTDEVTGEKVLRYGGDFDDRPSDYEFSGNGLLFADRTEKPAVQEVRYYYGLYR